LEPSSAVYKIMGPVLLKVDLEDAKQNVSERLSMIKTSM
jgi:chaperonin cofactor prefoldin